MFRICSEFSVMFRIFSEFLEIFRIFRHFSEYLAQKLVYSESLDFLVIVTVFLPMKLSVLLKKIFSVSLKSTKITLNIQISQVGHVTYSFINMLFISTGIFYDKLRPQILLVGTTANSPLTKLNQIWVGLSPFKIVSDI